MLKFQKKVLKNGLRVILAPMENTEAATFMVLVGVGSRHETKEISGVSHFLEHMVFKGTKSRPKLGQVHRDLDKIGAVHNAFTSKEVTGFWVKSSAKDFDSGIDIVSDILLEPLFEKQEIEKERGVILQEISMYEDEPRRKVWEILENVLYGDNPVGWDIAGTKESVSKIKRKDIVDYRKNNYLAKNMIVIASGNIDSEKVFTEIEKRFSVIGQQKNKRLKKFKATQKSARVKLISKELDQSHLALAFRAYDMFDKKRHALNLLAVMLGGNMSSRLMMEIREKLGLAYYVFSFSDQYTDCGYLGMGAGVAHDKLEKTVEKMMEITRILKRKKVSNSELKFAKSFLRGQMALKLETSDDVANFCGGQEIFYNKIQQPEEILEDIEKVNQDDILRVAKEVFNPGRANLVVIGNQENFQQKEKFYKSLISK
ncbi:MAG: insulinase family protein [Candidatus Marinimicrobia bacterium]|nr:insulinase family protein [Candidatus Neomarinimicrobiota bacterium]